MKVEFDCDNRNKNICNIELEGDIDCFNFNEYNDKMKKCFSKKNIDFVIVDMRKLEFIDSKGIEFLINIMKKMGSDKEKVFLVKPQNNVKNLLKITNLTDFFTFVDSDNDAKKIISVIESRT